jgi:hypothetical protein
MNSMSYEMKMIEILERLDAKMDNVNDSLDKLVKMMKRATYGVTT